MDWLKELLKAAGFDESKIEALIGDVNKELPKHFVPKQQYNDLADQRKKLEKDIADRDTQIAELGKTAGLSEELKKKIETLQGENKAAKEQYEAQAKELRLSTAVKLALSGKVHDPDIVASLLDKSKIELDDNGGVKTGLDDQIKALQTSKAFLFMPEDKGPKYKGFIPKDGKDGAGAGGGASDGLGADFAKAANESSKASTTNPWG